MDVSAIVLNKLMTERSLDVWAKLKLVYLDAAYSSIYSVINKHYETYGSIPSFDDLEVTLREGQASKTLATLKLTDVPDVSIEVALDALIDQYTQNETVRLLDKFVDKLPMYDTDEIKENLANIAMEIEEKTHTSEKVFSMADLFTFQHQDEVEKERIYLGLNNTFDQVLGGVAREELILVGGERGSGKSITASNLFVNQYEAGFSSLYFTIEMVAREVNQRNMAMLAGISYQNLKKNTLTEEEVLKLVKAKAGMFIGGESVADDYLAHRDRFKFEQTLLRECKLKPDNQMIIVDDRDLSISSIDLHIGKIKSRVGDKLGLVVVDYVNQIVLEGADMYDWKPQIEVSKKLKNLARKHGVAIVSPYQIDSNGEARFARGLLDAADIALLMKPHEKETQAISFDTTKIRGGKELSFTSPIDWETLRISPVSIDRPEAKEKVKRAGKQKSDSKSDDKGPQEPVTDAPW